MEIININAVYRALLKRGSDIGYNTIRMAINGELKPGDLTDKEKEQLVQILTKGFELSKQNIQKS